MVHGVARGALVLAAVLSIGTPVVAAPSSPSALSDVNQSYTLLTTSYYSKLDPQRLLDGARSGLQKELQHLHAQANVPALRATADSRASVAQLDEAIVQASRNGHVSVTALSYAAINGMTQAVGDRYTEFFTPDQLKQFNDALDPEKIGGIGVLIQPDAQTKSVSAYYVVPGTPADKAGIQAGDVFATVDGASTHNLTADKAVKMLRGKPGTVVHIEVKRAGKEFGTLALTRTEVQPPTVTFRMLPKGIGYIFVNAFGRETPEEFGTALDRLQKSNAQAFVIDLRNNGGGYVNSALDMSSRFVNNDPLLIVEERGSHTTRIDSDNTAIPQKPVTILVNRYTASASEIMSGALQDDGIGTLVGEKTFGKSVMQTLSPLADGAAIKITTAHYLTPKNRDINLKGIVPDLAIAENKDARFGDLEHDAQLQAAVTVTAKKIADATRTSSTGNL